MATAFLGRFLTACTKISVSTRHFGPQLHLMSADRLTSPHQKIKIHCANELPKLPKTAFGQAKTFCWLQLTFCTKLYESISHTASLRLSRIRLRQLPANHSSALPSLNQGTIRLSNLIATVSMPAYSHCHHVVVRHPVGGRLRCRTTARGPVGRRRATAIGRISTLALLVFFKFQCKKYNEV